MVEKIEDSGEAGQEKRQGRSGRNQQRSRRRGGRNAPQGGRRSAKVAIISRADGESHAWAERISGHLEAHSRAVSRLEVQGDAGLTEVLKQAKLRAVGLCYCRHKAMHHGTPCDKPMEVCTTLNGNAEWVIRRGYGREVSAEEALDIAAMTRDNFMVHIGDNVKNDISYICHCCGCHCAQLKAINHHGIHNAVHTSSYLASVDEEKCKACGRCVKNCPVMAIEVKATSFGDAHAEVDEALCLGCGVCGIACKNKAMSMKAREKRVFTPEDNMDRLVRAAVERGTIHHMLFDDPDSVSGRGIHLALGALLSLAPTKQLLAIDQIKSTFVKTIVDGARRRMAG